MKYYVIEIVTGDAKVSGKSIYEYTDRTQALASFHKKLGIAMGSDLYATEQILVLNSANGVEASEVFVNPNYNKEETPAAETVTE